MISILHMIHVSVQLTNAQSNLLRKRLRQNNVFPDSPLRIIYDRTQVQQLLYVGLGTRIVTTQTIDSFRNFLPFSIIAVSLPLVSH
jgi:hypothetical protein